MIFSSLTFLFYFLPVFIIACSITPQKYNNLILLIFSLFFYSWGIPIHIILLILIIFANYFCGLIIFWSKGKTKKLFLGLGISGNLGILVCFKYINYLFHFIDILLSQLINLPKIIHHNLLFPIGVSFYTFKVISYIIDVYRGRVPAEKNFLKLATYVSMFPLITAGPIVRYETVTSELNERTLSRKGLIEGFKMFIIGLSFKGILANQFALYADTVFSHTPEHLSIYLAWLGAVCYTLQIYFDFAGYSIMAIGLGKLIGFNFPDNFRLPYISQSVTEFWRRWHITLTSWFRDYLYIPLGGNRSGVLATYRNLFIVFLLCGLWHGSSFNFIVWGIYHGLFLILERYFKEHNIKISLPRYVNHFYLLTVIIIGWVFFRSENLNYAIKYIALMFGIFKGDGSYTIPAMISSIPALIILMLLGIAFSIISERDILFYEMRIKSDSGRVFKVVCYAIIFLVSVIALIINTHNPFIYQQF